MGARKRYWIYLLLFTLSAINYIDRIALSVASKPIAEEFGLSPIAMGYLFSSFLWAYLLCLLPAGMIVDRWGARMTNASSITIWSIATVLTGAATNFTTLIITRLAMGAGESSTFPAGVRSIREWVPVRERGFATTIFNSGAYAGPAFGALLLGWTTGLVGWRGSFIIAGMIGFVWLAAWLIWYRDPKEASWLSASERAEILAERDLNEAPSDKKTGASGFGILLRSKTIWGLALTQACAVYTQYLFLTWLPNYLQTTRDLSLLKTGFYTALPYGLAVIFGIILGRVSDALLDAKGARSGRRRTMVVVMMLCSAVILLAPYVSSIWAIIALVTISLTGISTAVSLNFALVNDLLRRPQDAGKATSIMAVGGNVFGLLAPIVTGYVIAWSGSYNWAFGLAGIFLVMGAFASLTLTRQPIA